MDFNIFLTNLLKEKKIDVGVYHSYLVGILEDTIDDEEKKEMILDIVSSLIVRILILHPKLSSKNFISPQETDAETVATRIFDRWTECHGVPKKEVEKKLEEVDIAELLKTTTNISLENSSKSAHRQLTVEEKRIKAQILASYSQTSDKEDDDEEESGDELKIQTWKKIRTKQMFKSSRGKNENKRKKNLKTRN